MSVFTFTVEAQGDVTFDGDLPGFEDKFLDIKYMRIVGYYHWDDRDASLHGQVKCTLLEGKKLGILGVTSSTFGEHIDALFAPLDLASSTGHRISCVFRVLSIDEDGAT